MSDHPNFKRAIAQEAIYRTLCDEGDIYALFTGDHITTEFDRYYRALPTGTDRSTHLTLGDPIGRNSIESVVDSSGRDVVIKGRLCEVLEDKREASAVREYITDGALTEVLVNVYTSQLYRDGHSYHLCDFYGVGILCEPDPDEECDGERTELLFEYVGPSLLKVVHMKVLGETVLKAIFMQILHTIHVYQMRHQIMHGDLSMKNICLKKIPPAKDRVKYKGQLLGVDEGVDLSDTYYSYVTTRDGESTAFYLPAFTHVPVIIDFDISSKHTHPKVYESIYASESGYSRPDGKAGRCLPAEYDELYDPLFITYVFVETYPEVELFTDVLDILTLGAYTTKTTQEWFRGGSRPKLSKLRGLTADERERAALYGILTNSTLLKKYGYNVPPSSVNGDYSLVLLGEISD